MTVTDPLPDSFTFVSATPSQGGPCTLAAATVTCDLGTLVAGATTKVDVHVTVKSSTTGTVTNTATVTSPTPDPDKTNNSSTVSGRVDPEADLSIVKTALPVPVETATFLSGGQSAPTLVAAAIKTAQSPGPVVAGNEVMYTLVVSNAGPADARAVTVTDHLPAGTTFASVITRAGKCANTGTTVTCSLGTVPAGKSVNIEVVLQANPNLAVGTLVNTATVSSPTHDPDLSNNSSTATSKVTQSADVGIVKTFDTSPTVAGLGQRFVIQATNHGPSDASNVVVTDPLPAIVSLVSVKTTQGSCTGTAQVTCHLGTLPAGGSATIQIDVKLGPAVPASTNFNNTASVSSSTPDPDLGNNTSTAADPVVSAADISLTKTAPASFTAGANGTYTFRVSNAGPAVADGPLTITDHLPTGLAFVSASGTGWTCSTTQLNSAGKEAPGPLTCTNPQDLGVGLSAPVLSVTVHVASDVTGLIVNTATVASRSQDNHPANNTSTTPAVPVTRPTPPPPPPTTVPPTTVPPTTVPPPTTTTTVPPIHIITGYGTTGSGGPTGTQFALAGLSLLAGGAGLASLRWRRRRAIK